jgi:succinate-acetate transporter protein
MDNQNLAQPKPWSNATPAGLVALAVATACFFALLTGRVTHEAMPLIGAWLLGGFVVQLVVALIDLKGGSDAGGNAFLFFCAFFMLASGLSMLLKYNAIVAGGALDARVDGYVWCMLTLVIWLWMPAFWAKFSLLSLVVLGLGVAAPVLALTDLGILAKGYSHVAAWALLVAGVIAVYLASAMVVNKTCGKQVYPLPK